MDLGALDSAHDRSRRPSPELRHDVPDRGLSARRRRLARPHGRALPARRDRARRPRARRHRLRHARHRGPHRAVAQLPRAGGPALSHEETAVAQVEGARLLAERRQPHRRHAPRSRSRRRPRATSRTRRSTSTRASTPRRWRARTSRSASATCTAHWAHGPKWEVYAEDGDTWRGLPAVTRLRGLDADIGLLPMHGHTRGHSAVIVKQRRPLARPRRRRVLPSQRDRRQREGAASGSSRSSARPR